MILGAPWGALGQTSGGPRAPWELTGGCLGALGGFGGFPRASIEGPWGRLGDPPGLRGPSADNDGGPKRAGTGAEGPWGDKGG